MIWKPRQKIPVAGRFICSGAFQKCQFGFALRIELFLSLRRDTFIKTLLTVPFLVPIRFEFTGASACVCIGCCGEPVRLLLRKLFLVIGSLALLQCIQARLRQTGENTLGIMLQVNLIGCRRIRL